MMAIYHQKIIKELLREMEKDDFGGEIYMNAILQKYGVPQTEMEEYILKSI